MQHLPAPRRKGPGALAADAKGDLLPRLGFLVAATLAVMLVFGFSVVRRSSAFEMIAGMALLVLVVLLSFVIFLLSLFREPLA